MENSEKNYQKWMKIKSSIHNKNIIRSVKEGDIWWAAIGENVGVEIDGKSEKYSRPVVVLKKHSKLCFTGVPLTSKFHKGTWYVSFDFQNKTETAILIQAKLMSSTRVYERMGKLSKRDYELIRINYIKLFQDKNVPRHKAGVGE